MYLYIHTHIYIYIYIYVCISFVTELIPQDCIAAQVSKETCSYGKRDLFIWQKSPVHMAKEPHEHSHNRAIHECVSVKRDLSIWQKSPDYPEKETYLPPTPPPPGKKRPTSALAYLRGRRRFFPALYASPRPPYSPPQRPAAAPCWPQ